MAFCLAFSVAGLVLCGAVGRGVEGYRGGLCLNQLIGCVLLNYLTAQLHRKVELLFFVVVPDQSALFFAHPVDTIFFE